MNLSICIPTYNRAKYIKKNIELLIEFIKKNNLEKNIEIIISNNASSDETEKILYFFQKENFDIDLKIYNHKESLYIIENIIFVAKQSKNNYFMWLGDDDYIEEKYLLEILNIIEQNKFYREIFCILPSFRFIDTNGNLLPGGRGIIDRREVYEKSFKSCMKNSIKGHQMSGLVFSKKILEEYQKKQVNNMYPFIFFVAYTAIHGKVYYVPEYPVKVTQGEKKYWNYGKDGLISEIFDNYKKFKQISYFQRSILEIYILYTQSWRYFQYKKKVISCIFNILKCKNMTFISKILFIPTIFITLIVLIIKKFILRGKNE